jgi:hypothetical protein
MRFRWCYFRDQSNLTANTCWQKACPEGQILRQLQPWCFVSTVILLRQCDLFLIREGGTSNHHVRSSPSPWPPFMDVSQPKHCGSVFQDSLSCDPSWFSCPRVSQSQIIRYILRQHLAKAFWIRRAKKIFFKYPFHLISTFHTGIVTVSPNLCTGFKPCRRHGLILQQDLPVCHLGLLAYLMNESSASRSQETVDRLGTLWYFPITSVSLCFSTVMQYLSWNLMLFLFFFL